MNLIQWVKILMYYAYLTYKMRYNPVSTSCTLLQCLLLCMTNFFYSCFQNDSTFLPSSVLKQF